LVADPLYGENTDSDAFYLEHILLNYRSYPDGKKRVVYIADDPDREQLSPDMAERIQALALDQRQSDIQSDISNTFGG